jgi:uncharacterized protein (DUF849 family)
MIEAAINGRRDRQEHVHLPVTALELLHAAEACLKAGAEPFIFMCGDGEGKETFDPDAVALQVGQLSAALPDVTFGISTGAWVEPDIRKRVSLISAWETLPDYLSVNGHEPGFPQVLETALKKGIGIEAGIRDETAARRFVADGFLKQCLRILIEPAEQDLNAALQKVTAIEEILAGQVPPEKILLHGLDTPCWPILKIALSRGYHVRIGPEDTLLGDNGEPAADNAVLVSYVSGLIC